MKSSGKYELSYSTPIGVSKSKIRATAYYKKMKKQHDDVCSKAIKNSFDFYSDKMDYSNLCNEFDNYVIETFFPHISSTDEMTDEYLNDDELKKLDEIYGKNNCIDTEIFKNWCREYKGLSDDVIESTIIYNSESDNYEDITYYIEEVEII